MTIIIDYMKRKISNDSFGERLTAFRKAKGLTQTELGDKIGISKRMVAYYEGQTNRPPAHLLIPIAKTLRITADELLGLKKVQISDSNHAKLWRRLKKTEQLSPKDQKSLFDFIDALLVRSKSKA
jgi:transcriptional regulator with XRE-family HTH domain